MSMMKYIRRGPRPDSCWAWRGPLSSGRPNFEGKDPAALLGAGTGAPSCGNIFCVNPKHRPAPVEAPDPPKPPDPPKSRKPKLETSGNYGSTPPPKRDLREKLPPPVVAPSADPPGEDVVRGSDLQGIGGDPVDIRSPDRVSSVETCRNGHPATEENVWTSPTTGKSRCRVCMREARAKKKASR